MKKLAIILVIPFLISCSNENKKFKGYIPINESLMVKFHKISYTKNEWEIVTTVKVVTENDTIISTYSESSNINGGFLLRYKEINPISKDVKVYVIGYEREDGTLYIAMASLKPF